jgi:phenylacetate-coenzyme A ligase PaaK-like adenylate-forming protein
MQFINQLLKDDFFFKKKKIKRLLIYKNLNLLTNHHFKNSKEYKKILTLLGYKQNKTYEIDKLPFIPVRLFKNHDLLSVKKEKIIKILNSSGTTNNQKSKIFLDKENATNQFKVLQKIMNRILGRDRLPMLIVDKKNTDQNRNNFNAKIAAINGFSLFGKDHTYLLDENDQIDYKLLNQFLEKNYRKTFFIFGFTSLIYENFIKKFLNKKIKYDFSNGILLHGGGWKKIENLKISNQIFKKKLIEKTNLKNIHNYYGLVEQTGSIFIECKCGFFVASDFSEVLVRDKDFISLKYGKKGFLQLMSLLPTSYPGQNILTEDVGELVDEKMCSCNMRGTKFKVHGRVTKAEIRGCSDI